VKDKQIPEIRFQGFNGVWEKRKLGRCVQDYVEKTIVQNQYPVLTSSQKHGIIYQEEYFADRQVTTENNIGYFVLPRGYFTFRSRSDNGVFKFNRNDLVDKGIISYFYPVFKIANGNSDFFLNMLNSTTIKKQASLEAEGTGQRVLSLNKFKNINVIIPEIQEQTKLGNLFNQLDKTIALHQQELTTLKQTKQGFLQKMFPKKGESVPEVRFPGFTGEWELHKLGNHSEILTGGTPKTQIKEYWEPKEIPWMSSGEVNKKRLSSTDNMISKLGFEMSSARWVKENSVLIALAGQGKTRGTVAINKIPLTTNQSIAAIVPRDELHYEFIFQNLEKRYEELRLISSGEGTRGGLNKQLVFDVEILLPSIQEQIKIGHFFKQLDDIIALHQHELDALKETKTAFLQKMFV
jgi:type I restriction enzyme S subunit